MPADAGLQDDLTVLFHELRNPITTARHWMSILIGTALDSELSQRGLEAVDRQLALLEKLLEQLLQVSSLRQGRIRIERTRLDFSDMARQAVEDHRALCTAKNLLLLAEVPSEPHWVLGDRARLAQVLGNLLQNAVKFTPPGGRITLSLEANLADRMSWIRLQDTGLGFEPEVVESLFRPFVQAERGGSEGGLGVGLAVVKALVELHGGTVGARSDGRGKGAEFVVRLPLEPLP